MFKKKAVSAGDPAPAKEKKGKKTKDKSAAPKRANVFGHPVRNLIVTSIVSILLGVAFAVKPYEVYTYCGYGLGGLIGVYGLVYIIIYFVHKPIPGEYRSEFAIGLVALLAGAYVAVGGILIGSGGVGYELIVKIIGILIAVDGLLKLQYSVDLARMKYKRWWISLILSILGIAIGVLTIIGMFADLGSSLGLYSNPYTTQYNSFFSGMMMLGIAFIVNGVIDLGVMTVVAVRNHKANREAAIAEAAALMVGAEKESAPDFFPAEDSSAPVNDAPSAEPTSEPAPAPVPVSAPAPASVPVSAPAPAPAAPAAAAPTVVISAPEQAIPAEE